MTAKLMEIVEEAPDIKSFRLRPEGEFKFAPGQWMDIRLTPQLRHHFTISAAPTEEYLQFTTKFREESEFKKHLWGLETGAEFEIKGPFGQFTLDPADGRRRIFLAGGIGITPFRSMIKYMADKQLELPVTLLYSLKNRDEGAFVKELSEPRVNNYDIRIIETEREGRLTEQKLKSLCPDWEKSTLWVAGPPGMVEAFVEMGQKMGYAPENIKSEEFTGY